MKDFYNEINIDSKQIEIFYVSSDKSDQEFKDAYAKMPWMTVQYSNPLH